MVPDGTMSDCPRWLRYLQMAPDGSRCPQITTWSYYSRKRGRSLLWVYLDKFQRRSRSVHVPRSSHKIKNTTQFCFKRLSEHSIAPPRLCSSYFLQISTIYRNTRLPEFWLECSPRAMILSFSMAPSRVPSIKELCSGPAPVA